MLDHFREHRPHDGSQTHLKARIALPHLDAQDEESEIPAAARHFSLHEITSGLPDDSREADEKETAERRLREPRGRLRAARAMVSTTPRLAETVAGDWRKAERLYVRAEIAEGLFQHGVRVTSRNLA